MSDKYLKSLIDRLNKNKTNGLFHLRPLANLIDYAKVWTEKPRPTDAISFPDGPYDIYFIKNQRKEYVGAVVDMSADLHWFVLSKQRGKGHLTKALKKTILPHLFQSRKEQRITIDVNQIGERSFNRSEKVALSVGFVKTKDNEYRLKNTSGTSNDGIKGQNKEISEERINELKRQINYLGRSIWLIETEIEMKTGDTEYGRELRQLRDDVRTHICKIEDIWWKGKNKRR
jgi:hypothetical protein